MSSIEKLKKLQLNKETIAILDKLDEIRAGGIVASGTGENIFITTLEPATFTFICMILKSLVECTRGNCDLPTIGYDEQGCLSHTKPDNPICGGRG
jgi:hypothetical protein